MLIDLSHSMQERVREWQKMGHNLDPLLLHQCSYYPRGGCQDCEFDSPNLYCKWSHILIDTRINPPLFLFKKPQKKTGKKSQKKSQKKPGKKVINLDILLSRLPEEVRQEIKKIIEGGETEWPEKTK